MNNKKISRVLAIVFSLTLLVGMFGSMQPASAANSPIDVNASAAISVEVTTGKILYAKNADEMLPIASMAKIMTEYLVLEAIDKGKITWDQTYTPSEYVYKISQNRGLSNVPLRQDGSYNVKELYEAMAIYSANGAAIGLAEIIAGNESNFVKMMNDKAKELGLKNYAFVNATGLENEDLIGLHPDGTDVKDENRVSAKDVALLSQKLILKYPEILETASIPKKVFREGTDDQIKMSNWNWMLEGLLFEEPGVDGLKTGSTDRAGSSFTATAERNGMRVITVVMNAKDGSGLLHTPRFKETKKLLDFSFNNYSLEEVYPKNYQVKKQSTLKVVKGKEKEVEVHSKDGLVLPIKRGEKEMYEAKFVLDKDELTAPIKKGDKVGTMLVEYKGKEQNYGFLTENSSNTIDVVTKSGVEKANWFVLMMRGIGGFFSGLFGGISEGIKGLF